MKFTTIFTLATVTLALNLDQVRLINDDELVIQDTEYGYPAIVNLKEEDSEVEATKKTKSTTKATTTTSSHVTSVTTTTTSHSSKKHSSTSTKHKTSTHSITKTAGADAIAASVGGPLLVALGLLL